jgi:hypothetical protein
MTQLLEQAYKRLADLPDDDQDAMAEFIIEELEDEHRWRAAFDASPDVLVRLAEEARKEHRAGLTQVLDPDSL